MYADYIQIGRNARLLPASAARVIVPSGNRKSACLSKALRPIYSLQDDENHARSERRVPLENKLAFIKKQLNAQAGKQNYDEERVREALRIVQRIAEENFHFTLTIGVSEVFSGLEGLSEHCRSAAGAVEQRYLHGYGQIFFSFETGSQEPATEEVRRQLARLEMQALRCLRGESYVECIEAVEQYAQLIRE